MAEQRIGVHETAEVHEILNFKTICMTKSKLIQGLVFDSDLKALLEQDVQQSMRAIADLQNLLKTVPNPMAGTTGVLS